MKHIQTHANHLKAAKYPSNKLKVYRKDCSSNVMLNLDINYRGDSCRYY